MSSTSSSLPDQAEDYPHWGHQLGRVRPVHGWVPKSVVGVRFNTDEGFGKMVMSVEGRESVTGVLNKLVYPDVEIKRAVPARGQTSSVDGEGDVSSPSTE